MPRPTPASPPRQRRGVLWLLLVVHAAVGCNRDGHGAPAPAPLGPSSDEVLDAPATRQSGSVVPPIPSSPRLTPGGPKSVASAHGLVVSVEPNATRAGVRVLEMGGNAIDAAVATAYALAVTHPSAGNIGGGGFMLVARPGEAPVAIDFRERAPARTNEAAFAAMLSTGARGPAASAVPGSVAGLNLAHGRFGRLPLRQVLAPAIELARQGHRLGKRQALALGWAWPELSSDPEARRIFGSRTGPLRAGEQLVQRDLAATLERVAERGDDGFYSGATARAIARAMGSTGLLDEGDLSSYRAVIRQPLEFAYRGYTVITMPPPSSGGAAVAQILLGLEGLGAAALQAGSVEEWHLFVEVSKRAQAQRRFDIVDPESAPSTMSAAALSERLTPLGFLGSAPPVNPERATPASLVHPLYGAAERELEHTTHFSVVDGGGSAVSCTTTLSAGFGARYVAAGTGVVMNNSLAAFGRVGLNVPRPGRRMLSSMAPTLVMQDHRVIAVVGSPGGDTIPSTIVQVLRQMIDHGASVDVAVEAPRIHHGFVPDELRLERDRPLSPDVLAGLEARGHELRMKAAAIGDANSILIVDGVAYGHADSREGGLALGPISAPP